MAELNILKE